MKKFISILLVVIILIFALSNVVLASDLRAAMSGYEEAANSAFLNSIGSNLYGIILVVGSAVAVGMIAIMAIKFMTSEAEEKAQVKKNLVGFSVGVIILLSVIGLLGIFKNIGEQISSSSSTPSIVQVFV